MSRLMECVPNFSEGNNQEVRRQGGWLGAAHGAQGEERGLLGVQLGVNFSQKG